MGKSSCEQKTQAIVYWHIHTTDERKQLCQIKTSLYRRDLHN